MNGNSSDGDGGEPRNFLDNFPGHRHHSHLVDPVTGDDVIVEHENVDESIQGEGDVDENDQNHHSSMFGSWFADAHDIIQEDTSINHGDDANTGEQTTPSTDGDTSAQPHGGLTDSDVGGSFEAGVTEDQQLFSDPAMFNNVQVPPTYQSDQPDTLSHPQSTADGDGVILTTPAYGGDDISTSTDNVDSRWSTSNSWFGDDTSSTSPSLVSNEAESETSAKAMEDPLNQTADDSITNDTTQSAKVKKSKLIRKEKKRLRKQRRRNTLRDRKLNKDGVSTSLHFVWCGQVFATCLPIY